MSSLNTLIGIYIFIVGLCTGSFLNVVILRSLSGEDFVFARSKCPKCNNQLKWYMNIPLISYIFLKGKCAYCKEKISLQYPFVEFLTGSIFLIFYLLVGLNLKSMLLCIIFCFFIILCATDFKEKVIFDWHGWGLCIVSLVYSYFYGDIKKALVSAIVCAIVFEIFSRLGKLIVKQRFFGEGDTIIVFALGALFPINTMPFIILLSFIIQSLISIPILAIKEFKNNKILSFSYIATFFAIVLIFLKREWLNYCAVVLAIALIFIIRDIKNKRKMLENEDDSDNSIYNLMPFAPALIFSAVIYIFYFWLKIYTFF